MAARAPSPACPALVASQPLSAWKTCCASTRWTASAGLLPKAYADLHFDFYARTLQGTPQQQPRWKRAVAATSDDLGDTVGQIYVKQYFPASSKAEVETMVQNIVNAFDQRIDTLEWMAPDHAPRRTRRSRRCA